MAEFTSYLGVLTDVQQKENNHGKYKTAWLESYASKIVFFNQSKLIEKSDAAEIINGKLVFFEIVTKQLERGPRLDASNVFLAWPAQIQDYLLSLNSDNWSRIKQNASYPFQSALIKAVRELIADTTDTEIITKLKQVELLFELKANKPERTQQVSPHKQDSSQAIDKQPTKSFLHHVFTANSPEYTSRLFPLLVEGVREIADEDSFRQALFLLEFNAQLAEARIVGLPNAFYLLATPAYRFQFWLRGLVPYCDTDILLNEATNGDEERKQLILERCKGEASALLVATAPPAAAPTIHAYFQSIKATLLEQLVAARTSIRVAVAWFTQDELFAVLCEKLQQNVVVELIINNDYINNWEFGLPFANFIELGGKLYLSEHPAMMHHKFCLIDEAILFTGSYNWTYYADLHNDENALCVKNSPEVVSLFKDEFERLKQRIGGPATSITHFPVEDLGRFERIGFREYLSKDIDSRVSYTRKARPKVDPQWIVARLNRAIEIDGSNEAARQQLQDVAPAAAIDNYAVRTQEVVRQQVADTATVSAPPSSPELMPPTPVPVTDRLLPVPASALQTPAPVQQPISKPAPVRTPPAVPVPVAVSQLRPVATPHPTSVTPTQPTAPATAPSVNKYTPSAPSQAQLPINTNISIPDTKLTSALYENLHLVFALDYSNSMESYQGGGYRLYSSGKIQKVINMLFGIAKGLTTDQKIDMILFEDKVIPLPEITKGNHSSYVQDEVIKYPKGGTNIYAPIQYIHEKYAANTVVKNNVFVILITDGENSKPEDNDRIKAHFATHHSTSIFWQFVGLGEKFTFLEEVAAVTNAAFFSLNDVQSISDDTLLERLLQKFPEWVKRKAASIA